MNFIKFKEILIILMEKFYHHIKTFINKYYDELL
jgi:hypothetical protein